MRAAILLVRTVILATLPTVAIMTTICDVCRLGTVFSLMEAMNMIMVMIMMMMMMMVLLFCCCLKMIGDVGLVLATALGIRKGTMTRAMIIYMPIVYKV